MAARVVQGYYNYHSRAAKRRCHDEALYPRLAEILVEEPATSQSQK